MTTRDGYTAIPYSKLSIWLADGCRSQADWEELSGLADSVLVDGRQAKWTVLSGLTDRIVDP